jgi:hypothetical protein
MSIRSIAGISVVAVMASASSFTVIAQSSAPSVGNVPSATADLAEFQSAEQLAIMRARVEVNASLNRLVVQSLEDFRGNSGGSTTEADELQRLLTRYQETSGRLIASVQELGAALEAQELSILERTATAE